jgi:hypothetical protein
MFRRTQLQSPNEIFWQIANHKLRHDFPPFIDAINASTKTPNVQSLIALPIDCLCSPMGNTKLQFSADREMTPRARDRIDGSASGPPYRLYAGFPPREDVHCRTQPVLTDCRADISPCH